MNDRAPDLPFEDLVELFDEFLDSNRDHMFLSRMEVATLLDAIRKLRREVRQ